MSISKIFIKCNNKYNKEFAQDVVENLCCAMGNMGSFMVVLIFQTANSKSALNKIRFTLQSFHQRFELRLEAIQNERHVCRSFFCSAPCPALRSVPLSGIEIVTLRFSPLFRRFAPYESLYLHQSKPKINHYQIKCF